MRTNDPGGSRTRDLRIKSPLLYQLSYRVGVVSNFACWNYLDNSLREVRTPITRPIVLGLCPSRTEAGSESPVVRREESRVSLRPRLVSRKLHRSDSTESAG